MGNITSVASLQSWTGMLFTYLRLYNGTIYAEKYGTDEDRRGVARMKKHRHWGQPYVRQSLEYSLAY
jgi:amino acid transporter